LINVTISANESLSASEASKIASILLFSVDTLASNEASPETLADSSADTSASILTSNEPSASLALVV